MFFEQRSNFLCERWEIINYIESFFECYAKIKDVRLVKNKQTQQQKDFAFVEFFTIDDAEKVLAQTNVPEFRVAGEPVTVLISRSKKVEDPTQGFAPTYDYQQQYPGQPQYDYSQYYQQMYQFQQPTGYIDYDAVGYTVYDQQQQQMQHALQQQEMQLPSSPYKQMNIHVQQPIPQVQMIPGAIQTLNHPNNIGSTQPQQNPHFDITYETFDQSDLIKQALENVKNHSLSLQQQKDEQAQKQELQRNQQLQEEQKKKEQNEKNQQVQKAMEEQKKILEEQQKALKKTEENNKMKDISQKIKEKQEEQLKQKQRLEKLKVISNEVDKSDTPKNNDNKLSFISFEASDFSSTPTSSTKTIDIQVNSLKSSGSSKNKERFYLCSLCKRKFDSDRVINLHYLHSKMHKDNLRLYGIT